MALSLTPALCATLLKPVEAGHHHAKTGFFGWFNRGFAAHAKGYEGLVARMLPRAARYLVIYVAIMAAVAVVYLRLPTSFLPNEDQGNMLVNVQLPPGATQDRTLDVMEQVEGFMLKQPEVQSMVSVLGFSFSGPGPERGAGLRDPQGLVRAQGPGTVGAGGRRARVRRADERHARCVHLSAEPAAHSRTGLVIGLQPSGCRTAPAWGATPCWRRATRCWAWPPRARC
jgi:hypothetical protein